ncbi:MAG: D-glutamate deacylase [Alphaproteobacteria bacterium]|nr:MAG: D-glutamate deacylase [Alphaproteobacteria bacterium]
MTRFHDRAEIGQAFQAMLLLILGVATFVALAACDPTPNPASEETRHFDIVIQNGRVIDPESGLDGLRNIGIVEGKILAITDQPMAGQTIIDADGMIVAPGFIDLHSHTPTPLGQYYQVLDGVTTALELEAGAYPVEAIKSFTDNKAVINYGASVSHLAIRLLVKQNIVKPHLLSNIDFAAALPSATQPATPQEIDEMRMHIERGLSEGGLGIGLLLDYISEAVSEDELEMIFSAAAAHEAPVFVHIRRGLPGDTTGLLEIVEAARKYGTPVHICHLNASAMGGTSQFLSIINKARASGVDITTEAYPWNAGSTSISAAVFDKDWQAIFDIDYGDIEWPETGERFTEQTWNEYREKFPNGTVIHHYGREAWTGLAMTAKDVIIASDAMPLVNPNQRVHPRGIGTFSKALGKYFTSDPALVEGLRKMTLLPALRLQSIAPRFERKGRIQIGMDADITIFDPSAIGAVATYRSPLQASKGITYVLVGGKLVVNQGQVIEDVYPGEMILGATGPH